MERGVVIEGYVAGGGVEMEGGDYEVRYANYILAFADKGEGGDEETTVVMRLVVKNYARLMGRSSWLGCGRHKIQEERWSW